MFAASEMLHAAPCGAGVHEPTSSAPGEVGGVLEVVRSKFQVAAPIKAGQVIVPVVPVVPVPCDTRPRMPLKSVGSQK